MSAPCLIARLTRPALRPTLHIEDLEPMTVPGTGFKTIPSQTITDLLQASNAFKSTTGCLKQNGE